MTHGRTIAGRYRLVDSLGGGAMGSVWLAEDAELERQVAVKLLQAGADAERFEREAHAAAALAHPNICRLYDYGRVDGEPYIVLEYLPGGSLEELLERSGQLPDAEAMRIAQELAGALAHAHARGVVHRDLKPANVLFDSEGRAKIADFGIARIGGADTLTETGTVLGTAAYIAPEQAMGEPATAAGDVYALGVILYRVLTGRLPFESASVFELVAKHRSELVPPIDQFRPGFPAALTAATLAALVKDPRERPADGAAFARLLRAAEPPSMPAAEERTDVMPPPPSGAPDRRLLPLLVSALALLVLLGAGIGAAFLATGDDDEPPGGPTTLTRASTPAGSSDAPTSTPVSTESPTSSEASTTSLEDTTEPATTAPEPTTAPTTTAPTTTAETEPPTTAPTTVDTTTEPTTTEPTTTEPTTTDVTTGETTTGVP